MLHVNLSKTNVIGFRNGGIIRGNEKLYFIGIQVEPCTYYKYWRVMQLIPCCAVQSGVDIREIAVVWSAAEVQQMPFVSGVCPLSGPYCGTTGSGV